MSPIFEKIKPVSKKARVVTLLRDAIISGAIKSGEQLVEAKIAQQFGVGQGLIREALMELERQGFVQRTPFSGTQVPKLTSEDAHQIYDLRVELEPMAVALAGRNATEKDLAALQEMANEASAAARSEDLDGFFRSHLNFRKKIWTLSANPYLQQALERVVIPLYGLFIIRLNHNREGILETAIDCVEHQDKILDAYRNKKFNLARRIARDFLVRMKAYVGKRV